MYSGSLTSTSISITYGSGSIDGDQITNLAYSIGGLSASMTVMGITSQTTFFTCTNQAQGILGMAYPALAQSIFCYYYYYYFLMVGNLFSPPI